MPTNRFNRKQELITNLLLLLQPFHNQQGWCHAEETEINFKNNSLKRILCPEKKELTSRINVAEKVNTVSENACPLLTDVKYLPAADGKDAPNFQYQTSTAVRNNSEIR